MSESNATSLPVMADQYEGPFIPDDGDALMAPPAESPSESPNLPATLADTNIAALERAVESYKKYLTTCFRLTQPQHWVMRTDSSGKRSFYLQGPGAESLCNANAITWGRPNREETTLEDARGRYTIVEVSGDIYCGRLNRSGYFVGSCDTRNEFWSSKAFWEAVKHVKKITGRDWNNMTPEDRALVDRLQPSFVSLMDIRKHAFTNWLVNGVTRLLGIRNPSEEMLREAGIDIEKIPSIDYGPKKSSQPAQSTPSQGVPSGTKPAGGGATKTENSPAVKSFWRDVYQFCRVKWSVPPDSKFTSEQQGQMFNAIRAAADELTIPHDLSKVPEELLPDLKALTLKRLG